MTYLSQSEWRKTMQYRKDKHGDELSILGFGCMRFTKKGGGIDIDKAEQEIMEAYRAGVNYFDTAYIYSGSEAAIGEIFERNGICDKVKIATKLPQYLVSNNAALDKYFKEELLRLRTDHVDYYLMHHLTDIAMWKSSRMSAFLMDRRGKLKLSPAYDLTFAYNPDNRWISRHQMSVNEKTSGITKVDLMTCGKSMGLSSEFCRRTIDKTEKVVSNWLSYAEKCGITEERAIEIMEGIKKSDKDKF